MDTPENELLTADEDFDSFLATCRDEIGEDPDVQPAPPAQNHSVPDNAYADKQKKAAPIKKDNSIRNLTILIIIELLGIAGMAAWWILRLL